MKKHINKIVSLSLLALLSGSCVSAREIVVVYNYKPLSVKNAMLQTSCPNKLPMANGFSPGCNKVQANSQANNPKSGANALAWTSVGLLATIFGATTFAYANKMGPFSDTHVLDDNPAINKINVSDTSHESFVPESCVDDKSPALPIAGWSDNDSDSKFIEGYIPPWLRDEPTKDHFEYELSYTCLDDDVIRYLNNLENCFYEYNGYGYPYYTLGQELRDSDNQIILLQHSYDMTRKCFLASTPQTHGTLLGNWFRTSPNAPKTIPCDEYINQNFNHDSGLKYDILMRLIGLPINTEDDVKLLAGVLKEQGLVNETDQISIGVTDFDNKQNRIFAAMFGDKRDKESFKKYIVSDGKGLNLHFGRTQWDDGGTMSREGSCGSSERYYYITPTSIEDLKDNTYLI